MPVLPDLCDEAGSIRVGPIATLVDYTTGSIASAAAAPDWVVTHDLKVHLIRVAAKGILTARGSLVRQARNHFVIESDIMDEQGQRVAYSWVTFTRLLGSGDKRPRRAGVPGTRTLAEEDEVDRVPIDRFLGFGVEAADDILRFEHTPVLRNSTGAIQGGAIATAFDSLTVAMTTQRLGSPSRTLDLHLYYLNQARQGPFEARGEVLRASHGTLAVKLDLVEVGREVRVLASGSATGGPAIPYTP
jgi:uncharacterized protein (TIGR00369 family)